MDGLDSLCSIHQFLGLFVTNKPVSLTRHSDYFVFFTFLSSIFGPIFCLLHISKCQNALSHIWRCSSKKVQHLYCCRDCVTRGPIQRQTRVTFHNFAEVNFRDFLLTGTDVQIGMYDMSCYGRLTGTFDRLTGRSHAPQL